jgi:predicted transcriptional regulator
MRVITIRIKDEIDDSLEKISDFRVPKSEHVRRAIDMYLSTSNVQRELKRSKCQ